MKWTNVEDGNPAFLKRVLTIDQHGQQRVLVCDMFEGLIDWYDEEWGDFEDGLDVTHWMSLPVPPSND